MSEPPEDREDPGQGQNPIFERHRLVAAGSALIGLGVGASSPALFLAGFSLRSAQIQRLFALIELLRGVTAFLVAPILLYLATVIGSSMTAGRGVVAEPGRGCGPGRREPAGNGLRRYASGGSRPAMSSQ
jgi:hypothetical protein